MVRLKASRRQVTEAIYIMLERLTTIKKAKGDTKK